MSINPDMHENESMEIGDGLESGIYFIKLSDAVNSQIHKAIKKP